LGHTEFAVCVSVCLGYISSKVLNELAEICTGMEVCPRCTVLHFGGLNGSSRCVFLRLTVLFFGSHYFIFVHQMALLP